MLVKITHVGEQITDAILIEGRTWNRTADLLEFFKAESDWVPGEHYHEIKVTDMPKGQEPDILGSGVNDIQLTPNFNLREFACKGQKCGCENAVKVDPELIRRLQAMRNETGKPIKIVSGYRCPTHNRREGGATGSQHLFGRATDIFIVGMPLQEQYDLVEKYFPDGGVGTGASWGVHVDTRGHRARWSY